MKKILSILCSLVILISSIFSINVYAKTEIPIAMALDNNYTMPTIVAMTSMLENVNSDTVYKFHLLLSGDFKEENKNMILSLKKKYPSKQFEINFIDMKNAFSWARQSITSITRPTYFRLYLPNLLREYDKLIYLDGDIIVNKDLSKLWNTDLKDNYIAGVRNYFRNPNTIYHKYLGIDDLNQYINAGVSLMNLKKLRDDKMIDKFEWFIKNKINKCKELIMQDQDTINACCYGKIIILPFEYNFSELLIELYNAQNENKKISLLTSDSTIIHYAHTKPWNNLNSSLAEKWWFYAKKSGILNGNLINNMPLNKRIAFRKVIQDAQLKWNFKFDFV